MELDTSRTTRLTTLRGIAEELAVPPKAIRHVINQGELESTRLGRFTLIARTDFDEYLKAANISEADIEGYKKVKAHFGI